MQDSDGLFVKKSAASMLSGKRPAQAAVSKIYKCSGFEGKEIYSLFMQYFLVIIIYRNRFIFIFQPSSKKGNLAKSGTNKKADGSVPSGAPPKSSKPIEVPEDVEVI